MTKEIREIIIGVLAITIVIGGALWYNEYKQTHKTLPYYTVEVGSEEFKSSTVPPNKPVGDFTFINQKGEKVTQKTFDKSIYVADYIFTTCPGICKVMTKQMGRVYATYKGNSQMKILSHTSKPEEDSIPILDQYARLQGVEDANQWIFVTGDIYELQRMAYQEYGIVNPEDLLDKGSFVHTEMLVLVDEKKYIRGYYDGTDSTDVEMLIQDIKSLLNEMKAN